MKLDFEAAVSQAQTAQPQTPAGNTSRDRALAAFMKPTNASQASAQNQSQVTPVANPSQISPEELSAISPTSSQPAEIEGQSTTNDSTPSEATKEVEKPISDEYAKLARREKALRAKALQQEQALKAKEAEIRAKEEALRAKEAEYQSRYIPKDTLKQDPLAALAELGLSYDQLTELALNAPKPEDLARAKEIKAMEDKIKALEERQEKSQKAYDDAQTQAYQQAISQIRTETTNLVKSDPNFETINATGSINDVVELIEETFKKDGILLTVEEAATEVENYLVEEAYKLARLSKIQQRLKPAEKPAATPKQTVPQQSQAESKPLMKTLTNSVGVSRPLSARDRAILAFKGEKN